MSDGTKIMCYMADLPDKILTCSRGGILFINSNRFANPDEFFDHLLGSEAIV